MRRDARSEPALGSLKPWPQNSSARQDRREETLLLRFGAVHQQRWTEQIPSVHTDPERRSGAGVLDLEDDLLGGGPAAAAVLLGPRHVEPPSPRRARVPTRGAAPSARRRSGCPHRDALGTRRRGDRGATHAARRGTLRQRYSARNPTFFSAILLFTQSGILLTNPSRRITLYITSEFPACQVRRFAPIRADFSIIAPADFNPENRAERRFEGGQPGSTYL